MKELSIEEKAKAYDEALKRAKEAAEKGMVSHNFILDIFPEPKELDNEKIRKNIIETIHLYYGEPLEDEAKEMIAWLEKQKHDGKKWIYEDVYLKEKEQVFKDGMDEVLENPQKYGLEKQGKRKPADKIEPIFKAGDWIIRNNSHTGVPVKVIEFKRYYRCELNGEVVTFTRDDVHNDFHLWTIQDAKDGDVLYDGDNACIFRKKMEDDDGIWVDTYCGVYSDGIFSINDEFECWCLACDCVPATKEQCELLFAKMKEAGYEWDADKKELKKIEHKSAWNEEDESNFLEAIYVCHQCKYFKLETWLKNLKDRVQLQYK